MGVESSRAAEAELSLLQDLAGLFVHDIGNPLQSVLVLLELSLDEHLDPEVRSHLGKCLESAAIMRRLILDFGALSRGGAPVSDTRAGVQRILLALQRRFERLEIQIDPCPEKLGDMPWPGRDLDLAFATAILGALVTLSDRHRGHVRLDGGSTDSESWLLVSLHCGDQGESAVLRADYRERLAALSRPTMRVTCSHGEVRMTWGEVGR